MIERWTREETGRVNINRKRRRKVHKREKGIQEKREKKAIEAVRKQTCVCVWPEIKNKRHERHFVSIVHLGFFFSHVYSCLGPSFCPSAGA